jgi:hypothetical protein
MDAVFTCYNVCEDIANNISRDVHTSHLMKVHDELMGGGYVCIWKGGNQYERPRIVSACGVCGGVCVRVCVWNDRGGVRSRIWRDSKCVRGVNIAFM